MFVWIRLLMIW